MYRVAAFLFVAASFAGGVNAAASSLESMEWQGGTVTDSMPLPARDACAVIADRLDAARSLVDFLAPAERERMAQVIFDAAHPTADIGDEVSAGPAMELVVHYQPTHYMALYHAGMAAHAAGCPSRALTHLSNFLEYYSAEDGWRENALRVLRLPSESQVSDRAAR